MTGAGLTIWLGPGYALHVSTEDGWQFERAEHRTWRVGFLFAARRAPVCAVCQRNPPDTEGVFCSKQCLYRYRTAVMDLAAWPSVGLRMGSTDGGLSHAERTERRAAYFAELRETVDRVAVRKEAVSAKIMAAISAGSLARCEELRRELDEACLTPNEYRAKRGLPLIEEDSWTEANT